MHGSVSDIKFVFCRTSDGRGYVEFSYHLGECGFRFGLLSECCDDAAGVFQRRLDAVGLTPRIVEIDEPPWLVTTLETPAAALRGMLEEELADLYRYEASL